MNTKFVSVIVGSKSDLPVMDETLVVLASYQIKAEVRVLSAHRTPTYLRQYVLDAEVRGAVVFIAAAGLAAHLAGAIAAMTIKPVIGVPMGAGPLNGIDALLSTVQMPGGIPVACMAIGKAGAKNAGYFAAQIMALYDEAITAAIERGREMAVQEACEVNNTFEKQQESK